MMSRIALLVSALVCLAGISHAADFSPTVMTLACPEELKYNFDGSPLTIPFTIEGVGGSVWLVINTRGQAENIRDVRNGHLGWHYVHKIDTTVYISQRYERDKGSAEIVWDGRNQDGNLVEPGEYDYYLWAYDDKSDRKLVSNFVMIGYGICNPFCQLYERGNEGLPLARPIFMGAVSNFYYKDDIIYKRHGTHYKWELGSDPNDVNMLQNTLCARYYPGKDSMDPDWLGYRGPVLDPRNNNIFYHTSFKKIGYLDQKSGEYYWPTYSTVLKWEFVTDGEAILDQDWLGWDEAAWQEKCVNYAFSTCFADDNYIYVPTHYSPTPVEWNKLKCISYDGDVVFDKMMHNRYMPEEWYTSSTVNCSIGKMYTRGNNHWFLLGPTCCLLEMIDTTRLIDDPDDETDMIVFENGNGDYFMDNGWQVDIEPAWYCINNYQGNDMDRASVCIDSNHFNIIYTCWGGITSFGVASQDGSKIDTMSFANDVGNDTFKAWAGDGQICDSGSNYDGMYMNGLLIPWDDEKYFDIIDNVYFIAFDSCRGVITYDTAVEEETPAAFHVEQNTPNPFNPTTTISFTIPEASRVQVTVFNIAGQKVVTLADDLMTAGQHAVTWDASDFSAGVYFCRVKAGSHEKTVKMTMVK